MSVGSRAGMPRLGWALAALVALCAGLCLVVPSAHAGQWIQVSCVNPNGGAASSQGWSQSASQVGNGSSASTQCGPGAPMTAVLSAASPDPVGAYELLTYTPPAGSTIIGGTVAANLVSEGDGPNATAVAALYEPQLGNNSAVVFCAAGVDECGTPNAHFDSTATLPTDAGGDVYVQALCGGSAGGTCENGTNGLYSLAQVSSADIELANGALPTGAGFTGTLLARRARGVAQFIFTAADPGGPGVYTVTATIDGTAVYSQTPNTDDGTCAPVGSEAGMLMFDSQQPCPAATSVDIPVDTAALSDGRHELTVAVTDAAQNTAIVLDRVITAYNPRPTPAPRRGIRARFYLAWRWRGAMTRLDGATVRRLPGHARVSVACRGRRCPRLRHTHAAGPHAIHGLLRSLAGTRFHAGDRVTLTVSARHRRPERILLTIRTGRRPSGRLLTARRH